MSILSRLFKGSNAHQTLTEWHPLEELDDELPPATNTTEKTVAELVAETASQCTAPTRSGAQCKFPARPGTDRCALPSHQRP